jgi:hypothetical protein
MKFGIFQKKLKDLAVLYKGLFIITELVTDHNLKSVDVR